MKFTKYKGVYTGKRKDGQIITIRQACADEWQVDYHGDVTGCSTDYWPSVELSIRAENEI